ncbi:MAG: HAD family hydrolase [Bacteroidales bacterium]|nr:HAD family hydrolase [Bacteroidales bacterium]
MINTIIWDWNGTLLDDLELSLSATNSLLRDRGLPTLSVERYKNIFKFPVIDYYTEAGFDFNAEPFETPAKQYMDLYHAGEHETKLFPDVVKTLSSLKEKGYRQIVLSAMEDSNLKNMIKNAGISHYFDGIFGIKDDFAREKISLGKQITKDLELNSEECVMIGDTLHDAEVADACGFNCVLYTQGHVSKKRLETKGVRTIDRLEELLSF